MKFPMISQPNCKGSITLGDECGDCASCIIEGKEIVKRLWRVPFEDIPHREQVEFNRALTVLLRFAMLTDYLAELREENPR